MSRFDGVLDDQVVRGMGFSDLVEFNRLVCLAPLDTRDQREAFTEWQKLDGTKAGLERLINGTVLVDAGPLLVPCASHPDVLRAVGEECVKCVAEFRTPVTASVDVPALAPYTLRVNLESEQPSGLPSLKGALEEAQHELGLTRRLRPDVVQVLTVMQRLVVAINHYLAPRPEDVTVGVKAPCRNCGSTNYSVRWKRSPTLEVCSDCCGVRAEPGPNEAIAAAVLGRRTSGTVSELAVAMTGGDRRSEIADRRAHRQQLLKEYDAALNALDDATKNPPTAKEVDALGLRFGRAAGALAKELRRGDWEDVQLRTVAEALNCMMIDALTEDADGQATFDAAADLAAAFGFTLDGPIEENKPLPHYRRTS